MKALLIGKKDNTAYCQLFLPTVFRKCTFSLEACSNRFLYGSHGSYEGLTIFRPSVIFVVQCENICIELMKSTLTYVMLS